MKVFDLLLTDGLDLAIQNGDFLIGESTEQHQRLLLESEQGEWRENPAVGVGLRSALLDDAPAVAVLATIQDQLDADGQDIAELTFSTDGKLFLLASYRSTNGTI
jgi:hypothetical protein